MTEATTIPAYDPDSPDVEILENFEKVRSFRTWVYTSYDRLTDPAEKSKFADETDAFDDDQLRIESSILDAWATTPSGVVPQLILALFEGGNDRWVDQGVMEQGLRALYLRRSRLDGQDRIIVNAAYELLHIEWEQALEIYERSKTDFEAVLALRGVVDAEEIRDLEAHTSEGPSQFFVTMDYLCGKLEDRFSNESQITRLIRTLAPDLPAYQRKAAIAIAEGYATEAAPWLVRDVNFLMGEIRDEIEPRVSAKAA